MRTLNIVGCGRAGRTFARVFAQSHAFLVQDLHDVNFAAARSCAQFADAGRPVRHLKALQPAQVWLIATPDDAIVDAAAALVAEGRIVPGNVVIHLSGATPSVGMAAVVEIGAHAGSVHPLKTFADPGYAAGSFAGTYDTVFSNTSLDPQDATISYTGGDQIVCGVCYLVIKDGNRNPSYYFIDLALLGWDGVEAIELVGFWPGDGAISHVAIWGSSDRSVPEPGTLGLLGIGLAGMGIGLRRRRKQ